MFCIPGPRFWILFSLPVGAGGATATHVRLLIVQIPPSKGFFLIGMVFAGISEGIFLRISVNSQE
jgi:hypothetical protein